VRTALSPLPDEGLPKANVCGAAQLTGLVTQTQDGMQPEPTGSAGASWKVTALSLNDAQAAGRSELDPANLLPAFPNCPMSHWSRPPAKGRGCSMGPNKSVPKQQEQSNQAFPTTSVDLGHIQQSSDEAAVGPCAAIGGCI